MRNLKAIVKGARAVRAQDEERPLLLATVVNVAGSSCHRVGARMLIAEDRWVGESVRDGRLEGDIIRKAWWFTRDGNPALLNYVSTGDEVDWGMGLGCDGLVDLLLEPCDVDDPCDPLAFLDTCLTAESPGASATILRPGNRPVRTGGRLQIGPDGTIRSNLGDASLAAVLVARAREAMETGRSEVYADGGVEALVEAIIPPPHVYLFGAGPGAVTLASIADAFGWIVTVCDPASRPWTRRWFAGADEIQLGSAEALAARIGNDGRNGFAVVMSHDYDSDRAVLEALFRSRVRYIGIPGPDGRSRRMLSELGVAADLRIHLAGGRGADSQVPAEIALAVSAAIEAMTEGAVAARSPERPRFARESRPDEPPLFCTVAL